LVLVLTLISGFLLIGEKSRTPPSVLFKKSEIL